MAENQQKRSMPRVRSRSVPSIPLSELSLEEGQQIVEENWQLAREARLYVNTMFKRRRRVQFGVLGSPATSSSAMKQVPAYHCRMFCYGKSGIGKTSTVMKLAGQAVPATHVETLGVQTTTIYWPAKTKDQVIVFRLDIWDTGEKSIRKFEHILPSCLSATNCIAFFFSYTDRSSWAELPDIISSAVLTGRMDSHLKVVVATRQDSKEHQVTQEEVRAFERDHNIKVLSIGNVNGPLLPDGWPDGQNELRDIVKFMNSLTHLYIEWQTSREAVTLSRTLSKDAAMSDV